jgi:uncharacterized protein (TIGR00255 family)
MKSMTGYGYAEQTTEDFSMTVELKSYNNRYLDINHNIPFYLARYEQDIDNRIKSHAARGHVDVNVRIKQLKSTVDLHVDEAAVQRYRDAFATISQVAGLEHGPALSDYVAAEGVLVNLKEQDCAVYEQALWVLLEQALRQLDESKLREGSSTQTDLSRLGGQLQSGLERISSFASELEERLKANLVQKFEELLGPKGYDENRFLQEVAVMLNRYSINEELVRLAIHLKEYRTLLDSGEPVGKRLDFLSQEMNREINTIASKSVIVEVNQQVVAMKDALENIREQVRNIE